MVTALPSALLLCRKPQVHQKAHRPAIMPGELAHKNANDIFIQRQHHYTDHQVMPEIWRDDVLATAGIFKSKGVELVAEPKKELWRTMAKFRDPDGNEFVFSSR